MQLSIIIVNYHTKDLLFNCLKSIVDSMKNERISYEIIIVDNGSREPLNPQIAEIKNLVGKTTVIENRENLGFGSANNQGVGKSCGKYVLFLNTDIEVLNKGVVRLFDFIDKNEQVGIVGGKLLNYDKSSQPSCGPFYSLPIVFASLFLKGDKIGLTRYSPAGVKKVDWVSGACFMIRKSDFQALYGFDEKIFMYMEEVDLLYRAKKKGLQTYFYPEAEFIHLGAATSKKTMSPIVNIYQGLLYFYKKHRTKKELAILKIFLKLKAFLGCFFGKISNKAFFVQTYEKAYKLVR